MKKKSTFTALLSHFFIFVIALTSTSALAVPDRINYQGKLTDSSGVSLDGTYLMRFYLFDRESGGSQLWNDPDGEEQTVLVSNGIYNIQLGAVEPLSAAVFESTEVWLEIAIYNDDTTAWEILSPRQRITTTAYAFIAENAETLNGMSSGDFSEIGHDHDAEYVNEGQANSITSTMIVDSNVTADDLAENSVGASEIAANAVGSSEIQDGSVAAIDLNSNAVLQNILANDGAGSGLDADLLDGLHASSFANSSHNHDSRYYTETESNSRFAVLSHLHDSRYFTETESNNNFVNINGDSMTAPLDATYSTALDYAIKGIGELGPTQGYLGVQGNADYDGIATADWLGKEIGVAGISTGASATDNYGVIGHSTYVGVRGEYSASPTTDYGELGRSSRGAVGKTSYTTGRGVEGVASNSGDYVNYGGHFTAAGDDGRAVYGQATGASGRGGYFTVDGQYAQGVYARNEYGDVYAALATAGTGVIGYHSSSSYGWVGTSSYALYGQNGNTNGYGLYAYSFGSGGRGVYARASASNGTGIYAYGGSSGYAGHFRGKVRITDRSTDATVMELGAGLDYAEGFDVSEEIEVTPGTVLIIDPNNPGKLKRCDTPYDTKVAGIVAGAKGLGSGVRLGADQFDKDVALAGRVYCNVDATNAAIKTGDLLTTAALAGYAMKAEDYTRAQGAILGKAMQDMEKGQKGQILVLVTLQ